MLNAEQKNKLIEAYLVRSLSDADRLTLEQLAKQDPLFLKELVDTHRAISLLRIENSTKIFQSIYDNTKNPTEIDISPNKNTSSITRDKHTFITTRHLLIAACVTLALVIGVVFFITYNTNTQQEQLLSEYFEPYPNIAMPLKLGVGDGSRQLKEQAYEAYENRNYASAISLFEKANSIERDPYVIFYLGVSYLSLENGEEAIKQFTAITNTYNNFPLLSQTKWYLGLSYIEDNEVKKAKLVLNDLISHDSVYKDKAENILKALN